MTAVQPAVVDFSACIGGMVKGFYAVFSVRE